jgi:succinoglycan biosynthesis protein ExoM
VLFTGGAMTNAPTVHVTVCVCTYRRPELLGRLLGALGAQRLDPGLSFDVVVADDDVERSAESVVRACQANSSVDVTYVSEPARNIAVARNAAVRAARGPLLAFLDDDEWPVKDWLSSLYRTLADTGCDGVLGPVLPDYPDGAPAWLRRSAVFDRRRLETGARITHRDARTGNVLLHRAIVPDGEPWFDPEFGRSGGEDSDFFKRQFERDRDFRWCDEAIVHETVAPDRWGVKYHLVRRWRTGSVTGAAMRRGTLPWHGTLLREVGFLAVGLPIALPLALAPRHMAMRVWQKIAYSAGLLGTIAGVVRPRARE